MIRLQQQHTAVWVRRDHVYSAAISLGAWVSFLSYTPCQGIARRGFPGGFSSSRLRCCRRMYSVWGMRVTLHPWQMLLGSSQTRCFLTAQAPCTHWLRQYWLPETKMMMETEFLRGVYCWMTMWQDWWFLSLLCNTNFLGWITEPRN